MNRRSLGWSVLTPEQMAEKIVKVIERGRGESVFPRWMRIAGVRDRTFPWNGHEGRRQARSRSGAGQ